MAQLALSVAGAAAGFAIGGPAGAKIGFMVGSIVGSTLFAPTINGPRLNDLRVTASTIGVAIPEMLGTVRLGGNMIWTTGIEESEERVGGGKGGPSQTVYTYSATFAMGICKGPIDDLLRIWADGKLIYDKTNGASREPYTAGTTGNTFVEVGPNSGNPFTTVSNYQLGADQQRISFRLYKGTETQLPDSLIEADVGDGNASAHRGLAYIVVEDLELGDFGNRIPQLTFEVTKTPRRALPILTALQDDEETIYTPVGSDSQFFPDWELGIVWAVNFEEAAVFDLDTMVKLYDDDGNNNFRGWDETIYRQKYLQGEGIWLATENLSNSSPLVETNVYTVSTIGTYGVTNNSTRGFVNFGSSAPIGFDISNVYGITNAGEVGYCRTDRNNRIYLTIGFSRYVWILNTDSKWPAAGDFRVDWIPGALVEGRRFTNRADIIGWRSFDGNLELMVWSIGANIDYSVRQTETGQEWVGSDDYVIEYFQINPFESGGPEFRDVAWDFFPTVMLYDETDDCIFSIGRVRTASGQEETGAFKWQRVTEEFKFARIYFEDEVGNIQPPKIPMTYSHIEGGSFGWMRDAVNVSTAEGIWEISLQNGEILETDIPYGTTFGNKFVDLQSMHWDDRSRSLVVETQERYVRIFFGTGMSNITIRDVVREICLSTRLLEDSDIDVMQLNPDELTGYYVDNPTTARDVLRQLSTGFMFDGFESDNKLVFRSRGRASDVTIPEDWIVRDGQQDLVSETITQEVELPMRVTINYYDIARDHQQGSQSHKRLAAPFPAMFSERDDIVDLPVVWQADLAKQAADKLLMMSWANRVDFGFKLPFKYLKYDPSDVATLQMQSGTTHTVRFTDLAVGADFSIEARGQSEKASAYDSDLTGSVVVSPFQILQRNFPSTVETINTPLLRDIDYDPAENARVYFGVNSLSPTFSGANVFVNEGYDYSNFGFIQNKLVTGFTQTALPPTTSWGSTDNKTELFVRILDRTVVLESVTQEDMLNDETVNAALVGNEIIQFREVELQPNGTWKLTGLLRARRGTNYAVNDHLQGDRFVLLDSTRLLTDQRPPANYFAGIQTKAVPRGIKIAEAESKSENLTPRDLQPFTPEGVAVTDDDTTVTISMQRRSRITSPLVDGTGFIHYKEGDRASARIHYAIWFGLNLSDANAVAAPDVEGDIAIFDASGDDLDLEVTFPLADLSPETKILVRLFEVGAVDGIPKWVEMDRLGVDLWNVTELY